MSFSEQNHSFAGNIDFSSEAPKIMNKIANFLIMKDIFIGQFWQSNRNYASCDDINQFCQQVGLKLSAQDLIALKSELFFEKEVISIYQFCDIIPQWRKSSQDIVGEFLKQRSQQLMENLKQKNNGNKMKGSQSTNNIKSRPASVNHKRLMSGSKQKTNRNKENRIYRQNNSKKYLESFVQKSKQKEQQLAETIQRTKNEYQYSMLIKMNEMNQINRKNKSPITYRAYKNAQGNIKIMTRQINIKQFESDYKIFMKSIKENKQWERPTTANLATGKMNKDSNSKSNSGTNALRKNQKKQERQKQLRSLLDNTIKLTQVLQEQIKVFKSRGIYGSENYVE